MRVAALDLGSNSFHLLIADVTADGDVVPVVRKKEMLHLGDVVARRGRLTRDAIAQVLATLADFHELIEDSGATKTVTCATAAFRDAANVDEVVQRIARETGLQVDVLDGQREAALIFEAIRRCVVLDPSPVLAMDLGGGSLEVMIGDDAGLRWSDSLPLGVARLTARHLKSEPPVRAELDALHDHVTAALAPAVAAARQHRPAQLIGSSGTLLTLATVAIARRGGAPPASLHQATITRDEVAAVHRLVTGMTLRKRRRLPGVSGRRAEQLPAGATLLLAAMDALGQERLTLATWALREGMALSAADRVPIRG